MVYPVDRVLLYHAMLPTSTMGILLFRGGTNKFTFFVGKGVKTINFRGSWLFLVAK